MLQTFDADYIKKALENHGMVQLEYGVFENHYANKVVERPIRILGIPIPFIRRKRLERVVTHKDLVMKNEPARNFRNDGPAHLQEKAKKIAYDRIFQLDEKIYGKDLVIGFEPETHGQPQKYSIMTKSGVVIGQFDIENGYYSPKVEGAVLPDLDGQASHKHLTLENVVAKYCAQNPETIDYLPEELSQKFPELDGKIQDERARLLQNELYDENGNLNEDHEFAKIESLISEIGALESSNRTSSRELSYEEWQESVSESDLEGDEDDLKEKYQNEMESRAEIRQSNDEHIDEAKDELKDLLKSMTPEERAKVTDYLNLRQCYHENGIKKLDKDDNLTRIDMAWQKDTASYAKNLASFVEKQQGAEKQGE